MFLEQCFKEKIMAHVYNYERQFSIIKKIYIFL